MSLVASSRPTRRDIEVWQQRERVDATWCKTLVFARRVERARAALAAFVAEGPCYCGVSWGKDSVVVAHMAAPLGVPLVTVEVDDRVNPDNASVRAAFLARIPAEHHTIAAPPGRRLTSGAGFDEAARRFGARHISGVRGEESGSRTMRMRRWGTTTALTCAPIGWWTGRDVFAYLYQHELPVHPAYACSYGGVLDRDRIRVAHLGGERGTGMGRREWEQRYYPDEMAAIERARHRV